MKNLIRFNQAGLILLGSLFSHSAFASAPTPEATITIGAAATALIGSEACFSVDLANTGTDVGFGPYYRLILPPDLTLASANFLGQAISTDALGVFPAAPGNQIADTRANNASVTGDEGYSLTNLVLPLSSITQNGPTITTDICVDVSTTAELATPLDISLQPVFQYGDTATGDNGAIAGAATTSQITPTLMTFTTSNNAPAGKQVPGTTFGLTYAHVINVAEGQLVTASAFDETFSTDLSFDQFNPAAPTGGTGCAYGAAPGTNVTATCAAIFGLASDTDVATGYDANINDILDEGSCANQSITLNSTLDGTYGTPLTQATDSNTVSARHLTLIKSLSGNTFNPGDTLTVSGTIRVSDFATVNSLTLIDQIPDGLSFGAHGDLTINGGASVAIVPATADTGGGTSTVSYDLTAVSGNIAGGSQIDYSYTLSVDTNYNDAAPVLASDDFSINSTATYSLTGGASNCSDLHSASMSITAVTFDSEIVNPQAEYNPGEVITYRLSMTVPSGDTQSINYTTYFPLPIFDVSTINLAFGNDIVRAATDTMNSTPDSISVDAATNALTIVWPDINTASTQTLAVDVAITVTDDPFADNLFLTTLFSGQASNTPAVINADINPVQTTVRNADLTVVSGISTLSHEGTLSAPASDPADSDASGVDAGDTLTQVITITNDGGSSAYKLNISQPDLAQLTGYTLTSALNDGVDVSGDYTGNLSTTLVFDNSVVLAAGKDLILSYQYQIDQSVDVMEVIQPQVSVTWSASTASATAFPAEQDSLDINIGDISITASVATVNPEGHTGNLVVGDVVTYQADVTLPEGTVTDLVVDFALPAGLEYVAASGNVTTGAHTGTIVAEAESTTGIVATGQTHTFTFTGDSTTTNNNNNADNTFTITLDALVKDDAANAATGAAQNKTINVGATYQGNIGTHNDNNSQNFTEHDLAVTTTVAPDTDLQAGDSATITFVVTNNGTAPAYDVDLSNTVDSDLFDLTSVATGSAGCNYVNPTFSCTFASIAVGASETVSYTATVQSDVQTGSSYTITANVTGDSQSGAVADERDQSTSGNDIASSQALGVNSLTVIATSETFTTTAANEPLAIGETISYQMVIDIPEGISKQTTNNDFVSFTLPAGLQYIANSGLIRAVTNSTMTSVTLGGNIPTTDTPLEPTIDDAASITGQSLTFDLGDVDNNDDDASTEQMIITITALVLNTDTNTTGHSLITTGAVNYLNKASANQSASSNHTSVVMLPAAALTHTATPTTVEGSDAVTYTLTATNTAGASATNGYDWEITGTMPAILNSPAITSAVLSRGSVDISGCAGFTGNALAIDGSCLAGGQNGAEHYLAPGETITVIYTGTVDASVGFEQTIDNTMAITMTSLSGSNGVAAPGAAGSDKGERIGDNSNNDSAQAVNDLVASDTASITSGAPTINLASSKAQAQVLETVTLTATFGIPVGTTDNFVYNLDLPAGLTYQNDPIVINLPGSDFTASNSPSTTPGAATDPISLDFGTITNSAATAQSITIAINVEIDNVLANQNSTNLTASAGLSYTGVVSAPSDTAVVGVIEPNLTINQLITAGNVGSDAGDTISYQVTVANTSTDATAYRVNLAELLPTDLLGSPDGDGAGPIFTNIRVTNPADAIVLNNTATPLTDAHASISTTNNSNDTLGFSAFDLPPSTTLTYSYDVVVANSALVGATITNNTFADYNSLVAGGGRSGTSTNDDDNDAALDNYYESDSSHFTLASAIAIQHNLTAGQPDSNFAIGETVNIDVRVDLTEGTTNNVQLQQVLDSGLTFVSASVVAEGHISYNGAGTAAEAPVGTIAVDLGNVSNSADADNSNDFVIWRIVARVNDEAANVANTVLNANASATSDIGNAGPETLSVTVVEPNMIATITPSSATTSIGDEVTFTLVVTHNASGADAFDTELDLVIPDGLSYVAGSFSGQGNLDDSNSALLNVDLSSIALADTSKTFSFRAKVDNDATPGASLTVSLDNTSSYSATSGATSDDRDYNLTANGATTVTASSFIDAYHQVTIIGDNGNGVADAGETLQYTIVLTNNDGSSATNVVYNETIPADTSLVTSSLTTDNGATDENNNNDLIVNVGTMTAGQVVTISYQVTIDAGTPAGTDIIAQGSVDSDQTISELSDNDGNEANGDQATVTPVGGQGNVLDALYVQQLADWTIDGDNDNNVSPGDTVVIHYYIQNRGDSQLTDVSVDDIIADGLTYVAASANTASGSIDVTGANVAIDLATLDSGEQVYAALSVIIDDPLFDSDADANNETFTMQAAIDSNETSASQADQNGIIEDGNQPTTISAVVGGGGNANPQVMQTWSLTNDVDDDGLVDDGDEVTYWLTVVNQGAATATNVNLSELIPTHTTLVAGSVVSSQGVVLTEAPVSLNLLDIGPGQLVTLSYKVTVDAGTADGTVVSAQADLTGDNFAAVQSDDNGDASDGINPTLFTVNNGAASDLTASLQLTASSDNDTTGNDYIQGETLTIDASFNIPAGTTDDLVLTINIPTGLSYQAGSATLAHDFDTGLTASHNPASINGAASGATVNVDSLLSSDSNSVSLTLGTVVNSDNDGDDETYKLSITLTSAASIPTAATNDLIATAVANFLDNLNQSQASQSPDLTLTLLNRLPIAVNDSDTTDEDNDITLTLMDNDSDNDNGQTLSISDTTTPANGGNVVIAADGNSVTFTPAADFVGTDSFDYTLVDSAGGTSTATVTITVDPVQDPPVAANDAVTVDEDSVNNTVTVLSNDDDVDGDPLTVTTVNADNGTVTINGDGTLNYTPNGNFNGTDTITYTISDGNGGTDTATVTVTVTPQNDPPVAVDDSATVDEDSADNTIVVLDDDSDLDGDSLSVSSASATNGTVTINGDGSLNYTPNSDFNGTDTITYTISDGNGGTDTATVTVTVTPVNDPPVAVDDSATVDEDSTDNTIVILDDDSDVDGDPISATTANADNGTVTINPDGSLSYTPDANFSGTDTITYTISDGNGGTDTATVTVTVNNLNDAPVAVDDSASVEEDSSDNTIVVLDNDTDIDGDTLTVTDASVDNGTVTINPDGSLNYTPDANFNGTATITYTISDGNGGTDTATVTVTVTPANDPPVAVDDSATVSEDSSDNNIVILDDDSDVDGDTITTTTAIATNGTVTINDDGSLNYTPNSDFNGTDTITYTISDGNGGTDTATVTVTVDPLNDPPVAVDDTATVSEDSSNNTIVVLDDDSDVDGDNLTVTDASVDNGTVSINPDGSLNYTPDGDFNGTAIITYTISDGNGGTDTATVTVTVTPVNDLPIAVDDTATVTEDSNNNTIVVLDDDSDPDGDSLSVVSVSADNGTVTMNPDGTLNYTPNPDFNGTDTITYTISDGNGGTTTATVTVTVTAENDPPVASDDTASVDEGSSDNNINVLGNDSDPDGDTLTVTAATADNGTVTINADGSINYTPAAGFSGTDTITYTISDGNGGTTTATVTVTVNDTNADPVAVNDTATVSENSSGNPINVLGNDSDPDGDTLTVTTASASNGTVTINADGTISYTPNPDFAGTDTITYTISDGNGGFTTATVTVTVEAVNQPPVAQDDSVTVEEDSENTTINVLANDSDPDGEPLTVTAASSDNGTVTINDDGTISYTPNPDFAGTDTITYTVSDGNGGFTTATVTVTVTGTDDPPIAEDDFALTEQDTEVLINILDNDSDPDGDQLTVIEATSAFGTVVINEDGSIRFTPDAGFTGEAVINYTISDGNGGTATAQVHVVIDPAPEPENNPPVAVDDEVTVQNSDPVTISVLDNDSDPDGHQISLQIASSDFGTVEIVDGNIVFTPNEGLTGEVTITYSIVDEFGAVATATVTVFIDIEGPVITLPADLCGEFTVDANALYTRVNLGEASAVDRFGNPLPVSLTGDPLYPPGLNEAYWQATDSEGNTTVSAQKVCVNPLISLEKDQTVPEGEAVKVGVFLNGEAPVYPLTVTYSISGDADSDDHTLIDGEITFEQGSEVYIHFQTLLDSVVEANENIVIDLTGDINMGNKHQHITTINEGNIAPEVSLKVVQAQQERLVVSQQDGLVTVDADINDPNIGDTFAITWTNEDGMLVNISEQFDRFVFDPSALSVGLYQVAVAVVDNGEPQLQDISSVYIEVVAQLNDLSAEQDSDGDLIPDSVEGYADTDGDGVADYLDRIDECNVLSETVEVQDGYLIEGEPGVCLRRGYYTVGGETGGAQITPGDIEGDETDELIVDVEAENVGGVFDYIAYGMPEEGSEYAIVMPQLKPVPLNAVYRKFFPATGTWGNFIENDTNSLWSTAGEPGYCPPPNSNKDDPDNIWSLGLNQGHWCVQMIIEDGGINDDDGEVNGNIVDPGGVGVLLDNNHLPVAVDDYRTMPLNDSITIDVLENDSDEDGDALTVTSAHANFGTVEIVANQLVYTSLSSYGGLVTIDYGIRDEDGGTDHAVVYIDFISNTAPVAVDDSSQIEQGQTAQLNLLANDSDADGDQITLIEVNHGQVSFSDDGQATFTPSADFYGEVVISYTITDSAGNVATAQWRINVSRTMHQLNSTTTGGGSLYYLVLLLLLAGASRLASRKQLG